MELLNINCIVETGDIENIIPWHEINDFFNFRPCMVVQTILLYSFLLI
jgi:hypothetical protein